MTRIILIEEEISDELFEKIKQLHPDKKIARTADEAMRMAMAQDSSLPHIDLSALQQELEPVTHYEIRAEKYPDPTENIKYDPEPTPRAGFKPSRSMKIKNKLQRKRR